MKVIALEGPANTGKSHAINVVYHFLLRDGYVQIPGIFRILGNPPFEDFMDILEKDNIKVGFVGMGDFVTGQGRSLKSLLSDLDARGCDVAICACRNKPKILSAVTAYSPHFIIPKTLSTGDANNRIVNVIDAETMIKLI